MSLRTCVSIAFVKMVCLPVRSSVGKVGRTALGRRERRGFRDIYLMSHPHFFISLLFLFLFFFSYLHFVEAQRKIASRVW